jgi:hypothetical protein
MSVTRLNVNGTEISLNGTVTNVTKVGAITTVVTGYYQDPLTGQMLPQFANIKEPDINYQASYMTTTEGIETLAVGEQTTIIGNINITNCRYKRISDGKVVPFKLIKPSASYNSDTDKFKLNGVETTDVARLMSADTTITTNAVTGATSKGTLLGYAITVEGGTMTEYTVTGTDYTNAQLAQYYTNTTLVNG